VQTILLLSIVLHFLQPGGQGAQIPLLSRVYSGLHSKHFFSFFSSNSQFLQLSGQEMQLPFSDLEKQSKHFGFPPSFKLQYSHPFPQKEQVFLLLTT
jgi:hypothetical protein